MALIVESLPCSENDSAGNTDPNDAPKLQRLGRKIEFVNGNSTSYLLTSEAKVIDTPSVIR